MNSLAQTARRANARPEDGLAGQGRAAKAPPAKGLAALLASLAWVLPFSMSYAVTPSPNHPRIMAWYRRLKQPFFKPNDALIPAAWFVIEACLARGAYRLLQATESPERKRALGWLGWNVFMIGGWSRLFFGRRDLAVSTVAAASMIASSAAYVHQAKKVDVKAAHAGIPLVAWVSFATVLTATIWAMNRRRT